MLPQTKSRFCTISVSLAIILQSSKYLQMGDVVNEVMDKSKVHLNMFCYTAFHSRPVSQLINCVPALPEPASWAVRHALHMECVKLPGSGCWKCDTKAVYSSYCLQCFLQDNAPYLLITSPYKRSLAPCIISPTKIQIPFSWHDTTHAKSNYWVRNILHCTVITEKKKCRLFSSFSFKHLLKPSLVQFEINALCPDV